MANLNPRTDSFISMLIDVSGRARTGDVQGVSQAEAATLLQAYAEAHPERALSFDGEVLSSRQAAAHGTAAAAVPEPAPSVSDAPQPEPSPESVFAPQPVSPVAGIDSYAAPIAPAQPVPGGAEEMPNWFYEGAPSAPDTPAQESAQPSYEESVFGAPPVAPAPSAPDSYGVPLEPSPGGFYGVAEAAEPEYAAATGGYAVSEQFVEPPTPSNTASHADEFLPPLPQAHVVGSEKMPWWWYVIAWAFWPIGGIVGYFVVRGTDPKGARNLIIFTVAMFLVSVLLVGLSIALLVPMAR